MTTGIRSLASQAYDSLPTLRISTPANVIKKLNKLAIPAILLLGAQQAQQTEGAFLYALCLVACLPLAEAPPLLAVCIAACTPLLPLP